MFRSRRFAAGLVVAALLAGALIGKASTSSNTVPNATVGQGSAAASPYAVSGVTYSLNTTLPQNIDQVSFTISPTNARVVKARLSDAGSFYSCTNTSGAVTCATTSPQATATGSTNLTVVATQ